jgi:hypothetical protein
LAELGVVGAEVESGELVGFGADLVADVASGASVEESVVSVVGGDGEAELGGGGAEFECGGFPGGSAGAEVGEVGEEGYGGEEGCGHGVTWGRRPVRSL